MVGWLVGALSPVNHKGLHQGWLHHGKEEGKKTAHKKKIREKTVEKNLFKSVTRHYSQICQFGASK